MDFKHKIEQFGIFLNKNKIVVLIFLLGITFLVIPLPSKDTSPDENIIYKKEDEVSFEEKLEKILNHVNGAGKVEVILTVSEGEEIVFQTDESLSSSNDISSQNINTVTTTDANKNENGLIRKKIPPIYRGAIIVCQGADDPVVKLAITEAVARLTGIKANCISVLKMK